MDAIAATGGPGLIGGVIVGVMTGKAIAAVHGLPFLAVNHLEGHALTARLTDDVAFPYLLLLVSGGHCQLLVVEGVGRYRRLGTTVDDAAGEAFDKGAKLLGLGYPGGPAVERAAAGGQWPARFDLPRPMLGRAGCDFSFSGLKTALRHRVLELASEPAAPRRPGPRRSRRRACRPPSPTASPTARATPSRWPARRHPADRHAGGRRRRGRQRRDPRSAARRSRAKPAFGLIAPPPSSAPTMPP